MSDAPVTPIRSGSLASEAAAFRSLSDVEYSDVVNGRMTADEAIARRLPPVASAGIPAAMLHEKPVRHVLWQYGLAGQLEPSHYQAALMTTFQRADEEQFANLRSIEPVYGFWMDAMRFGDGGHHLALRALALIALER